jgi:hypothetical protein
MKSNTLKFLASAFAAILFAAFVFPSNANAQKRDYMSEAEADIVRFEQEIDRRVDVLVTMIDRRFAVLNNQPSPVKKDSEKWGEPPQGTRLELLSDISKLLQKAIDDIDDVAAHERMDSKLFPKAMKNLSAAAERYLVQLKTEYDKIEGEKERGTILGSIESCQQIIEASAKIPKDLPKEDKKKKT